MPPNQRTGQLNTGRVLREIWMNRGISRIDLSQKLDLNKSTVTLMVNPLLESGLLETLDEGESGPRGGRKPLGLGIRAEYAHFLGIEVRPGSVRFSLLDLWGRTVEQAERPYRKLDIRKNLAGYIGDLYKEYAGSYEILGVGIGISGIVDPFKGIIRQSALFNITSPFFLREKLTPFIPCQLMVENDAKCCAWGELLSSRQDNILYILLEFLGQDGQSSPGRLSVGMGLAMEGKVYHGSRFSSGEFRSPMWGGDEKSQFSLDRYSLDSIHSNRELRRMLYRELASNTAFLVNVLNLNQVVIGGDSLPEEKLIPVILEKEIQINWPYPNKVECSCGLSSRGEYAVAHGAAAMHLERIFATGHAPVYQDQGFTIGIEALQKAI